MFANHICTLEQYLKFHQATTDHLEKFKLENLFPMYLVVHCWEKMLQQVADWASQGCIFVLGKIHPVMLRIHITHFKEFLDKCTNRNSNELGELVVWMVENGVMARVILELSEQWENQQLLKNWRTLFEPGGDHRFLKEGCHDYMLGVVDHDFTDEGDIVEAFLVWIHLQSVHLLALGTISRAFGFLDLKIPTFSRFTVKYTTAKPSMEDWEATLDKMFACDAHGNSNLVVNADSVKKAIFDHTSPTTTHQWHNDFANFQNIHQETKETLNPHSGMLLCTVRY